MGKLDELRTFVAKLFEAATDKSVIEQAAVVASKIDEINVEQEHKQEEYNKLLSDYKDVVIHSSFKPKSFGETGADNPSTGPFDASKAFEDALNSVLGK